MCAIRPVRAIRCAGRRRPPRPTRSPTWWRSSDGRADRLDQQSDRFYPRNAAGNVIKYNDLPARYRTNVDTVDAPFNRHPGDPPALIPAEIQDVVAFLDT